MTDAHAADELIDQVHRQNRWRNLTLVALGALCAATIIVYSAITVHLIATTNSRAATEATAAKRAAQAADEQAKALQAETAANNRLLEQLTQALAASHSATDQTLLDLLNDNRRIHGCFLLTSIAQLATDPPCAPPPAPRPAPRVVRPAPPKPRPTSTTTTTTTLPPSRTPPPPPTTTTTTTCVVILGGFCL